LCYFANGIVATSLVLEDITRALAAKTGCPVLLRALVPCNSTVVVFDIYGEIDQDHVAIVGGEAVAAVSVVDAVVSGEPNEEQFVLIHPVWTHVATGVMPPDNLLLRDTSEDVRFKRQLPSVICGVMTRSGYTCKNPTKHSSGLCWRHRPGK
jgi:hypothetical protein